MGNSKTNAVDRPIFLLGNQGDGLTIVARMLRRNPEVVSVSGDYTYWAGADEMQRAMVGFLPADLSSGGRFLGRASRHPVLTPPRSWSYACDDLIKSYRRTSASANERDRRRLLRAIGGSIRRHGSAKSQRFLDKSQTYTVRLGYLNALLKGCDPHFLLITRNPYASVYRAAIGKAGDMERYSARLTLDDRFDICLQHWVNSMQAVMEDSKEIEHFSVMAFEDLLSRPRRSLSAVCRTLGLVFEEQMVPAQGQRLPFGTRFGTRWFPLRTDVNDTYLEAVPDEYVQRVTNRAGERAQEFGYLPPTR
jgi:hypothetical protein